MTLKLSYPAHLVGILFGAWLIFLLSLLTPALQRELIFLNRIHWPPNAQFDAPERYGLAPFKTRNLYLNASDGERIGAWHILPRKYYLSVEKGIPKRKLNDEIFDKAFGERPTVLYMHGNAGTRAVKHRVRNYMVYSDIFDCNVLAIDYRGFGDSSGMPSEFGLITDARAAWNFVSSKIGAHRQHGWSFSEKVRAEKEIILIGQSLGTGVVAGLSGQLAEEGIHPRAIVLVAPFTSLTDILSNYWLAQSIPILSPFRIIPPLFDFLKSFLVFSFDSASALPKTDAPILIIHARDDSVIPHSHSSRLFSYLLSQTEVAGDRVKETIYDGWGLVRSFPRDGKGDVIWFEGLVGGHDQVGLGEGAIDLVARVANL